MLNSLAQPHPAVLSSQCLTKSGAAAQLPTVAPVAPAGGLRVLVLSSSGVK
jgi:hypothetical protein